jgi:hypothetical protein
LDRFASGKPLSDIDRCLLWGKRPVKKHRAKMEKAAATSWRVAPAESIPLFQEAVRAVEECQENLDQTPPGTIDHEIASAELEAATARHEWMMLDLLYFGDWLGEPKNESKKSRIGRPPDPEIAFRDKRIAAHSLLLEQEERARARANGKRPNFKKVIGSIASLYRVNRSTIFSARKRWYPPLRKLGYDQCPARERHATMDVLESVCLNPRLRL